jgi:RNA polymerase sigma-70 factor, ECF subfamily
LKKIQKMESLPVTYPMGKISPRYEGMTDEVVLKKYLEGDERAFTELYERYWPRVFMGLRRRVESEAIAEEIVQEAFLKVFRYAHRFDFSRSFATWMFVITINLLRNHLRDVKRREGGTAEQRKRKAALIPQPQSIPDPLTYCIEKEMEEIKLKALHLIDFDQACTYLLYENTSMEYGDIAQATSTPIGTVKSRLHRARDGIRRQSSKWYLN